MSEPTKSFLMMAVFAIIMLILATSVRYGDQGTLKAENAALRDSLAIERHYSNVITTYANDYYDRWQMCAKENEFNNEALLSLMSD